MYVSPLSDEVDIVNDVQFQIGSLQDVVSVIDECIHALEAQSGIEQSYVNNDTLKSQNVRFSDQHNGPTTTIAGRRDPTRTMTDTKDASLENFFSRPIKIHEQTWSVGSGVDVLINPWSAYFDNVRVQNRTTTFNLIRADMHVKIVINGNGFYYGRALAMYGPFNNTSYDTLSLTTNIADITQWSQRPKIFIDPTTSMGGEMIIPYHDLVNNSWVQNTGIGFLGTIWMRSINLLQHANGGTDPLTISVYAWAENVELSVLTSVDAGGLAPQSGEEVDEANQKGVISGPATAIAKWSNYLRMAPVIGPYATATSKAASTTAEIAKLFGYSRPPVTKAPEPYRPTPISSMANTTVPDVVHKLTVDDKQELTIDPAIAGHGEDDLLSISSIASRESYFTTFAWNKSTSAEGTGGTATTGLLWNCRVDPAQWNTVGNAYLFPACAAASMPFKYWTGTMKFRFQIVCSAFHKGRLKFVYDPNFLSSNEYNTNYLKIVDIAEEQDVTLEVGIGQNTTLIQRADPSSVLRTTMVNTTPLTLATYGNGVIGVYVVNELTTPNSTASNDIEINVYISMGDDFEVFVPDTEFQKYVFKPQSGLEPQSGEEKIVPESQNTDEANAPVHMMSENIAVNSVTMPTTNLVYTGESIRSFRTMLKRYNRWLGFGNETNTADSVWIRGEFKSFPLLRGNVAGAIHQTAALAPYNYVNTVMLHWVTYMFSGWRGGIRYKVIPKRGVQYCDMVASRHNYTGSLSAGVSSFPYVETSLSSNSEMGYASVFGSNFSDEDDTGAEGLAYTTSLVNPVMEFEVPFYHQYRFIPGKVQNWAAINTDPCLWYSIHINQINDRTELGSNVGGYDMFVAAGEDFQTYFFTGLPRMYLENSPPLPKV